jgi:tRNA(adenine34) deaminase
VKWFREADLSEFSRISRPDFMGLALNEARKAASRGEVPVGAVVVREGTVLSLAGNRTRELNDPTAHAEILAIREACQRLGAERISGCDLYVTLEPCAMCAGAISFARLRRLYFSAPDPKGGAVVHGGRFFSSPTCHSAPEVYEGFREAESAALLRDFFETRR